MAIRQKPPVGQRVMVPVAAVGSISTGAGAGPVPGPPAAEFYVPGAQGAMRVRKPATGL